MLPEATQAPRRVAVLPPSLRGWWSLPHVPGHPTCPEIAGSPVTWVRPQVWAWGLQFPEGTPQTQGLRVFCRGPEPQQLQEGSVCSGTQQFMPQNSWPLTTARL